MTRIKELPRRFKIASPSKRKLDLAKTAVETAIKQGEQQYNKLMLKSLQQLLLKKIIKTEFWYENNIH